MSLIKCPECGHEISSYADKCIYCGCPMEKIVELTNVVDDKQDFYDKLTNKQKNLADEMTNFILDKTTLVIKRSKAIYGLRTNDKKTSVFEFRKRKSRIHLVYLGKPRAYFSLSKARMDNAKDEVLPYLKPYLKKTSKEVKNKAKKPDTKPETVTKAKPVVEKKINKDKESKLKIRDSFYENILLAIKKRKIEASKVEMLLCKNIADFVINEVRLKALADRDFKTSEEFDRFRNARRYRAVFFEYTFSFSNLKKEDAIVFFDYYRATALIGKIKEYEAHLNAQIIDDQFQLLKDFYLMIKRNDIDYSRANGINSNFGIFVPEQALDDCLNGINEIAING